MKILKKVEKMLENQCFSMIFCCSWGVVMMIRISGCCDVARGGHAKDMESTCMSASGFPECGITSWVVFYVFSVSRFVSVSTSHPAR